MSVQVQKYYARWSPPRHHGYVIIFWNGGSKTSPEGSFSNPIAGKIGVSLRYTLLFIAADESAMRYLVSALLVKKFIIKEGTCRKT